MGINHIRRSFWIVLTTVILVWGCPKTVEEPDETDAFAGRYQNNPGGTEGEEIQPPEWTFYTDYQLFLETVFGVSPITSEGVKKYLTVALEVEESIFSENPDLNMVITGDVLAGADSADPQVFMGFALRLALLKEHKTETEANGNISRIFHAIAEISRDDEEIFHFASGFISVHKDAASGLKRGLFWPLGVYNDLPWGGDSDRGLFYKDARGLCADYDIPSVHCGPENSDGIGNVFRPQCPECTQETSETNCMFDLETPEGGWKLSDIDNIGNDLEECIDHEVCGGGVDMEWEDGIVRPTFEEVIRDAVAERQEAFDHKLIDLFGAWAGMVTSSRNGGRLGAASDLIDAQVEILNFIDDFDDTVISSFCEQLAEDMPEVQDAYDELWENSQDTECTFVGGVTASLGDGLALFEEMKNEFEEAFEDQCCEDDSTCELDGGIATALDSGVDPI